MVNRIDIERALDAIISDETGMKFQGLAVVLAKLRWPELVARERKNDLGLDAYASALLSPDHIGKGFACSITPTLAKITKDAERAKKNFSDIASLIFSTASKVTGQEAQKWSEKIREEFGYELTVISREDIITSLQLPDNAGICRTHLGISLPYQPSIVDLLRQTREACMIVSSRWASHPRAAGKPQIPLSAVAIDEVGGETRDIFTTDRLHTFLLHGRRLVLEGSAGRGKTTTLIQLARANGDASGIPFLIDLSPWTRSGGDILEYIAHQPAFRARSIDAAALARLGESEPFVFLLNGWNEISEIHAIDAANALRDLERNFPRAGIIVATRAHHSLPPLPGSTRFRLLPLTPPQRFRYIQQAVGDSRAQILHVKLSADKALDELTRTPFILSEVTTIFRSGRDIPRTKLGLLGAVVGLMEQSDEHQIPLQSQPLWNRAGDYLNALANHLTARGDVTLTEDEGRSLCHAVSEHLRETRQISSVPEPADILSALGAHHILERLDYPEVAFRFEHQQLQEYYSALMLRHKLKDLRLTDGAECTAAFVKIYINEPAWEEPLRMVAEEIGAGERTANVTAEVAAGTFLVESALRVDPIFAATLARLCGPSVWSHVSGAVNERLRSWYRLPSQHHKHCALAAMIATGSEEFSDILLPLLSNPDPQTRLSIYRMGVEFHTSSLGTNWPQIVAQWQEQSRLEFMTELTVHQGRADVALGFASSDASPTVRLEAIRDLFWIGQLDEVSKLLQALSDSEFAQAIAKLDVDELPLALRARAISHYKHALAIETDAKARLQIVLKLSALGDDDIPLRLRKELATLPPAIVKELGDHFLGRAIETVRKADPAWVSQWVSDKIVEGTLWPDSWLSLIPAISDSLAEQLLERVSSEQLDRGASGRIVSLLGATADESRARAIFLNLCAHRRQPQAGSSDQKHQDIDAQLRHLFLAIPVPVAVGGLSDLLSKKPDKGELGVITEMFGMFGRIASERVDLRSLLSDQLRQRLRRYLKSAVDDVVAEEDYRGEAKARLATALAEVGDPDDSGDLLRLIRADIQRVRNGRAAFAQNNRNARAQGGMMSYSNWHVQALIRLDHEEAASGLLDLLKEAEYEVDAAWGLHLLAKSPPGTEPILAGRHGWPDRDYRKVRTGGHGVPSPFDEQRRAKYAAALRQRISALMDESRCGDHKAVPYHHRLKELAKALSFLDPEQSADLIMEIAALPATFDGWLRVALIETLLFAGVPLLADRVIPLLNPVIDQWRPHGMHNDGASLYARLLCILCFVDPPEEGIRRVRELSLEFRLPVGNKTLMVALGQSASDDGLNLLQELTTGRGTEFQNVATDWIDAVAASPHPEATTMLLSFIDPDTSVGVENVSMPDYALDRLASRIAERANCDAGIADRIKQLCDAPKVFARPLLSKVVIRLHDPNALLAGLNLIDDNAPQPVPYDLRKAIEDVVLEKKPYKGSANSYTLVPRAATDIKNHLFELSRIDDRRSRAANDLLGQIEEWRLEHGRPSFEPRHPAYETGQPWPPMSKN